MFRVRELGETREMRMEMLGKLLVGVWIATEVLVLAGTRTRRGEGEISDRGSLKVLWVVILCSMAFGTTLGARYGPATFEAGPWLGRVWVGMMALGLAIRWTAIYTLGRAFSANVAIRATQTLNRAGLFRYVRHPSYTGMMVIFVAMGMATRHWLGLGLVVVPPMAALRYRMQVEEAALRGAFGAEYVEYSRRTKRLIPGIY